jgi:hypothetical protein
LFFIKLFSSSKNTLARNEFRPFDRRERICAWVHEEFVMIASEKRRDVE